MVMALTDGTLQISLSISQTLLGRGLNDVSCNNVPWRKRAAFLLIVYGVTMPPFTFNVSPET